MHRDDGHDGLAGSRVAATRTPGSAGRETWLVDVYGSQQWLVGGARGGAGTLEPMLRGSHLRRPAREGSDQPTVSRSLVTASDR